MQSIFRLPWCSDQIAPRMADNAALEGIRATPVVEIPMLNKLKRKRTNDSDTGSPPCVLLSKKQRADGEALQKAPSSPARSPLKSEREHVPAHTPVTTSSAPHPISLPPLLAPEQLANASEGYTIGQHTKMDTDMKPALPGAASHDPQDMPMSDMLSSAATDVTGPSPLQQVIENQFNMQILMKHNELRLIEQELAKCQIALEQLRRCEIRPYPGAERPSGSVSAGSGPSVRPPTGYTRPPHPAPHGVTDGPYTRHYRQWLLHDPQFDATPLHVQALADGSASVAARSTRNSGSVRKPISKSFSVLGRPVEHLQSIPNYAAPGPKDKSAPLILRRSTDGQLVKLICNNCHRGNFSSIQGFLNHCRIAHKVDYKSHDAAAVDCGRPLDEHETANLPPETQSTTTQKASTSRAASAVSTPYKILTQPMNLNKQSAASRPATQHGSSFAAHPSAPAPGLVTRNASHLDPSSFKPSPEAPRLSAHFAKYKLGGNLEQAIANAKQKTDMGPEEDLDSPDTELAFPATPVAGSRTVAGAARPGSLAPPGVIARPSSGKAIREPAQRPRPSPLVPTSGHGCLAQRQVPGDIPESPQGPSPNLSPHTADSNPGLVSDHEDDDHASASEDEALHSDMVPPLAVGRNCSDQMDIDVAVDDDIDQHGVIIRRNSMIAADENGMQGAGNPSRKVNVGKHGK